ncbi:hypothetical protein MY10362_003891 [Beauveria mimosiformis]
MDDTRAVPLRLDLDGAPCGAASSNPRATSSSPGVQSASIAMAASPYPTPTPSTSSMQTIPSDALVERESKRPRIISRHSGAISNTSTDLHSPAVHQSIEDTHDHLSINYPQASEMVSQPSSAIGVVASSTMPSDAYPVVGTPYWSNASIGVEAMGTSTSEGSDANNNRLGRQDAQMYGNSVAWGSQDVSMTMNRMHEYVPRRMTTSSWESEVPPHHHHHQQPQQPHQQMRSDGNLASPYESSSSAAASTPQMYGDYLTVNAPSAHRIVPSNAYPTPGSISTTPSTPHQTPGTTATWPRPSFQSGGGGGGISGSVAGSLPRDIKPKILPSSQPAKSSVLQQSNAAADGGDRTKGGSGGGGGGGGGDRTTHNDVERKYRTNLKDRIAELRAAVPALQAQQHDGESDGGGGGGGASSSAPKVSKGTVLSKATEYIRQLEQANRAMMNEHQQLVERLHTLEAMLQNGGNGGNGGGGSGGGGARCPPPHQYTANHGMAMFDPRGFS